MPKINLADGPHGSLTTDPGTSDEVRYWPYPPGRALHLLRRADFIVEHNIFRKKKSCNDYFKQLRGGNTARSFDEVWGDSDIWINYEPRVKLGWDGMTNDSNLDITIGEDAFRTGNVWYVTGILVHELAHTNGAGGAPSLAASTALKYCGLAALYDGAVGVAPRVATGPDERIV
jgi:hypothetical protein